MTDNFVMICEKDSVYLSRCKSKYMNLIEFRAQNLKIRIDSLLTFDIYNMMYELSKDIFDSYHIAFTDPADPSRAEQLFVYKGVMGLGKRYTHVYTHIPHLSNQEPLAQGQGQIICSNSTNVPNDAPSQLRHLIPKRAEQIDSSNSNMTVHVQPDGHVIQFQYKFKLKISNTDDGISVPPFVDKAVSIMMKTIFVRMKQFIECLG